MGFQGVPDLYSLQYYTTFLNEKGKVGGYVNSPSFPFYFSLSSAN